jgi:heat shock transcription factor
MPLDGDPSSTSGGTVASNGSTDIGLRPLADDAALVAQDDRLGRAYTSASQIDADVDALQSSLDGIIASLGIDPALAHASSATDPHASTELNTGAGLGAAPGADGDVSMAAPGDFDFDAFLRGLQPGAPALGGEPVGGYFGAPLVPASAAPDADGAAFGAFLDEIASQTGSDPTTSPITRAGELLPEQHTLPEEADGVRTRGAKRKSDVARLSPKDVEATLAVPRGTPSSGRPRQKK